MNKWTIELINKHIKVGYYRQFSNNEKYIVVDKDKDGSIYCYVNGSVFKEDGDQAKELSFYDQNMNLIEPPKERNFEIRCEFYQINSSVVKILPEIWEEENYVKLPNGRRYKRYKDNGELEVIENE